MVFPRIPEPTIGYQLLLFVVAAVLSPSGALGGVAEAFGVHEINRQISANVVTVDSVNRGLSVGGALFSPVRPASLVLSNGTPQPSDIGSGSTYSAPVGASLSPRSTGNATLDRLTVLSGPELATFVAGNPTAVQRLLLSPPRASSVATWWGTIPNAEQKTLATSAPQVIGNLDGVPVTVRDVANRLTLARSVAKLEKSIDSGVGRAKLIEKRHQLDILNQVTKTLERPVAGTKRQLLTLDPTGEVRAAVVDDGLGLVVQSRAAHGLVTLAG